MSADEMLLDALHRQAVKARKTRNQLRRKRIGTNGHRKKLHELEGVCRDGAILARKLELSFEEFEAMGVPGWRP